MNWTTVEQTENYFNTNKKTGYLCTKGKNSQSKNVGDKVVDCWAKNNLTHVQTRTQFYVRRAIM